ncbi:MAG: hypothetical protein Q7O66_12110, partial [Dehalococcoidia bacterium]|nr:hypothetical protein [Dehalococcoidia bacterium]
KARLMPRPMFEPPPVTITVFPAKPKFNESLLSVTPAFCAATEICLQDRKVDRGANVTSSN